MNKIKDNQMKTKRTQAVVKLLAVMVMLGFACNGAWAQFVVNGDKPLTADQLEEILHSRQSRGETHNGLHMGKKFVVDPSDETKGTLYLDSYVTGTVTVTQKHIPCDIVLVLDVSGSMAKTMSGGTASGNVYIARSSQDYSYDSYDTDIYTFYYKDGGNYYEVKKGYRGNNNNRRYYLYYTKNGDNYYLNGDTITQDRPTTISSTSATIWAGVLYVQDKETSRMYALKNAVSSFIDIVKNDAWEYRDENNIPLDHKISIVKYADDSYYGSEVSLTEGNHFTSRGYNYTEVVKNLTNVYANSAALKDAMNSLRAAGATAADYGMTKAQYVMAQTMMEDGAPDPNRSRVVVMFTDGEPNHSSGFSETVANNTIKKARNFKDETQNPFYKATVWSVGVFNNPSTDVNNYMARVSSNYLDATTYENGTQVVGANYYINATSASDLVRVFQSIASQSGGQSIDLGTQTIVQDVITPYFQLQGGVSANQIKIYTAQMTGYSDSHNSGEGDATYNGMNEGYYYDENGCHFGNRTQVSDVDVTLTVTPDGTQIDVTGFNYKDNWCGKDESSSNYVRPEGHKLILEIPIEAKDGVWGDNLPTNTELSVIFPGQGEQPIGEFPIPHHTITKQTWVEAVSSLDQVEAGKFVVEVNGNDTLVHIGSEKALAWFISYVTGFNGQKPHPMSSGILEADVDMSAYNWVPIGGSVYLGASQLKTNSMGYSGTFDGGGHSIKGLQNQPSKVKQAGLFGIVKGGTVKNVFVTDCDFRAGKAGYFGIIADTVSNGGVIFNSEAAGSIQVVAADQVMRDGEYTNNVVHNCFLGGVAGLVGRSGNPGTTGTVSAGVVHSCISVANLIGYSLGGVVNELANTGSAEMKNCYSYAMFHNWNEDYGTYLGGLVANNLGGKVQNCYIREREEYSNDLYVPAIDMYGIKAQYDAIDPGTKDATWHKGLLIGNNAGMATIFYVPNDWNGDAEKMGVGSISSIESFSDAETPYLYKHNDTRLYELNDTQQKGRLLDSLNSWVKRNSGCTPWFRTTAAGINDDYPVLKIADFECVASDSIVLHYGGINEMLSTRQLSKTAAKDDDTICLYKNAHVTEGNNGTTLYINEDVAILQEESLDAYVGITLDNSAGASGANSTHPDPTYTYPDDAIDWHMFATSLSAAPLGVNYNDDTQQWPFTYGTPTIGNDTMPEYRFYPETGTNAVDGYFPSHVYGTEYGTKGSDYYKYWDYYCWSEKDQHYINFKRNSNSHWKENNDGYGVSTVQINYNNEKNLVPGKGYMLATAEPTFLQSHGTLNNVVVTNTGITYTESPFCVGYNLVGNPYQSYLDFNAFANANDVNTYSILNEDGGGYETYTTGATSGNRYINMHQGFFIEVPSGMNSVVFNNGMRAITTESSYAPSAFRGEEQVSYPWVKITMTEQSGYRDYTTIEFDRPELGGGKKMMDLRLGDAVIYANYDGVGYSTFFATSDINSIPVRFVTVADGGFTLSWEMGNAKFGSIYLVDNINGQKIDMLSHNSYKFEGRASDYSSRFKIVFELTNTEEGDEEVAEDVNFAFQMDGNLVVNGLGHFEMFDNMGRLVLATDLYDTQNTIGVAQLAQGIYVLRLADEKNVKFQKIVVR